LVWSVLSIVVVISLTGCQSVGEAIVDSIIDSVFDTTTGTSREPGISRPERQSRAEAERIADWDERRRREGQEQYAKMIEIYRSPSGVDLQRQARAEAERMTEMEEHRRRDEARMEDAYHWPSVVEREMQRLPPVP